MAFPETFLPGYPAFVDTSPGFALWRHKPTKELYARYGFSAPMRLSVMPSNWEWIRQSRIAHNVRAVQDDGKQRCSSFSRDRGPVESSKGQQHCGVHWLQ